MSLLMAALAHGKVGAVSTLSSMSPVAILPMVWFRSGVAPPGRAWAGALLAVVGTTLSSL
jgi:drug/metabolite transporter (DMT)-like permease